MKTKINLGKPVNVKLWVSFLILGGLDGLDSYYFTDSSFIFFVVLYLFYLLLISVDIKNVITIIVITKIYLI